MKRVGEYIGFQRQLEGYGGSLAIARYIQAVETQDPAARDAIVKEIVAYNEEDLDATWAALDWLTEIVASR